MLLRDDGTRRLGEMIDRRRRSFTAVGRSSVVRAALRDPCAALHAFGAEKKYCEQNNRKQGRIRGREQHVMCVVLHIPSQRSKRVRDNFFCVRLTSP